MTDENVLSQEEIDALLSSVNDDAPEASAKKEGDEPTEENSEEQSGAGFRVENTEINQVDFSNNERIVRGQFPVLERIYDRMVRAIMDEMYVLMSREIEIIQEPFSILRSTEFFETIDSPMLINIFRMHPLRGKSLMLYDSDLIFELVDNFFGGHGEYKSGIVNRDLTPMEMRITDIFSDEVTKQLLKAWLPIMEIGLDKINFTTNPQLINIYSPSDILIISRFKCSFGKGNGSFYVVLPYTMIDPIREQLELGASQTDDEFDPNWSNSLKHELLRVPLTISAILSKKQSTLKEISEWNVGDFIPIEIYDEVPLFIEGFPTFYTKIGSSNDKCALQILSKIKA